MLGTEAPVDSIARDIKRGRNYTLGLGRATPLADEVVRVWPIEIAGTLSDRSQRSTLLVDIESRSERNAADPTISPMIPAPTGITAVRWTMGGDPSAPASVCNRQAMKNLGVLPRWREQYPLVILHLGALDSELFSMLGRLCDGIALAAELESLPACSLRRLSRILRRHQSQGCRLLGMWSIEIG